MENQKKKKKFLNPDLKQVFVFKRLRGCVAFNKPSASPFQSRLQAGLTAGCLGLPLPVLEGNSMFQLPWPASLGAHLSTRGRLSLFLQCCDSVPSLPVSQHLSMASYLPPHKHPAWWPGLSQPWACHAPCHSRRNPLLCKGASWFPSQLM